MNVLFYYFAFAISLIILLKPCMKKETYDNIIDYRIDLILHDLKKEFGIKMKEGFNSTNTESVGKYFKEKQQKIIYDSGIPITANYVMPFTDLNPYTEDYLHPKTVQSVLKKI